MKTFIRVAEVWVPSNDRTILEFGGGLYHNAPAFGHSSRRLCFGRGEGLPGQAWEQGHPVVLKKFHNSYFRRTEAAAQTGLTCGIAIPIFAGDFLMAVLVFFCGDDDAHAGAIEIWHNDAAQSHDLVLHDGYYGTTGEAFEFLSRRTSFRRGVGLPGAVWENQAPVFIEDLGRSQRFLRSDSTLKVGINRGFAIPCSLPGADTWILAFLSALGTPIARRVEVWTPDETGQRLFRTQGFCGRSGSLAGLDSPGIERGFGPIGKAFLTGVPSVTEDAGAGFDPTAEQAAAAGLSSMVAMPVIREGRLGSVVAWYF